ncbi:MAG TPA: hypothetical protein VJX67_04150 [Blastocatellia bacterium]|nr:hypothetical protein [Blastocatellia bacterium]
MPLAFYMDVHVPRAITKGLRSRGVDVLRAQDDGPADALDTQLLARATLLQILGLMDIRSINISPLP